MRNKIVGVGFWGLIALLGLFFLNHSAHGAGAGSIPVGTTLPPFKLEAPAAEADQEYLGLKGADPFTLTQVSGKLVLIEFVGVL